MEIRHACDLRHHGAPSASNSSIGARPRPARPGRTADGTSRRAPWRWQASKYTRIIDSAQVSLGDQPAQVFRQNRPGNRARLCDLRVTGGKQPGEPAQRQRPAIDGGERAPGRQADPAPALDRSRSHDWLIMSKRAWPRPRWAGMPRWAAFQRCAAPLAQGTDVSVPYGLLRQLPTAETNGWLALAGRAKMSVRS